MITYPRQVSKTWFMTRWPYRVFMLRELSGVFLAGYTILLAGRDAVYATGDSHVLRLVLLGLQRESDRKRQRRTLITLWARTAGYRKH